MSSQWHTITLDLQTPRSETILQELDLLRGLRALRFFSIFSFLVAIMCLLGLLLLGASMIWILAGGFLGLLGYKFHQHVQNQLQWRRHSLLYGLPVAGSIIRQRKKLNIFSSQPHHLMTAKFWLEQHEQNATGILWKTHLQKDLPQGAQIIGLWLKEQNTIWLPFEIGLKIESETIMPQDHVIDLEALSNL